ncbi:hypothetical protein [uncultured Granulicatella sp.]|jgi:hypothetical protein|uniref:hypothetical protein n=1 Tax=uncultured Granulicatella sp. TaxID=316089 RepID=UPI002619AD21|nr:hypothetical protein [uncultured Granulicatella sp.]
MTKLDTLKQKATELEAKLKQQVEETTAKLKEMKAEIERLENGWEMKCPYDYSDKVYILDSEGYAYGYNWSCKGWDFNTFNQGNIFPTKQAAELEAERRKLLTRFRAFRDECNNGWKPDWSDHDRKWSISKNEEGVFDTWSKGLDTFSIFGYFKNEEDCKKATGLFGDEIKALFVDCEGDA